jgi:hypothetical protein
MNRQTKTWQVTVSLCRLSACIGQSVCFVHVMTAYWRYCHEQEYTSEGRQNDKAFLLTASRDELKSAQILTCGSNRYAPAQVYPVHTCLQVPEPYASNRQYSFSLRWVAFNVTGGRFVWSSQGQIIKGSLHYMWDVQCSTSFITNIWIKV